MRQVIVVAGHVIADIIKNEVAVCLIVQLLLNLQVVVPLHIAIEAAVQMVMKILIFAGMIILVIVTVAKLGMV